MITYLKGLEIWPKLFLLVGTETRGTCGLTYMFICFAAYKHHLIFCYHLPCIYRKVWIYMSTSVTNKFY